MIRKIINSKVFRWAIMGSYAGLIFMGSSISQVECPSFFAHQDKFVHFIEYGIFCALLCWAISAPRPVIASEAKQSANQIRKFIFAAIILTSLYGITDEVHQLFVPPRTATVFDWLADTAGAAIAGLCWLKIFPAWKARKQATRNEQ